MGRLGGPVTSRRSSPQQFRAVSLVEATETLRDQYEGRVQRLYDALETIEVVDETVDSPSRRCGPWPGGTP